jgi:hypothetical protein
MLHRLARLARLRLGLLVLFAAGPSLAAPGSGDTDTDTDTSVTVAPDGSRLELVNAGEAPRAPLRYALVPGAEQRVRYTVRMGIRTDVGLGPMDESLPPMVLDLAATVDRVRNDGSAVYEVVFLDADTGEGGAPDMTDGMRDKVRGVVGTRARFTLAPDGRTLDARYTAAPGAPEGLMDQVGTALDDSSAILPVEPVGRGATWTHTRVVERNGIAMEQVTVYVLKAREGTRITLDVHVRQAASTQALTSGALPAGAAATLTSMEGHGQGRRVIDLGLPLPVEAARSLDLETVMRMTPPGREPVSLTMTLSLETGAGPLPAE